jgi:sugar phosphate isomerase/epimerase
MKIGVMNSPLNDLYDEIRWIWENGFDFIDLTIEPPKAYQIEPKIIKNILEDFELEAIGHTNPFLPSIFPIPSIKKACLDEFRRYLEIFKEIGIELVNIHPFYRAPFFSLEDKIEANIEFLRELSQISRDIGVRLMIENFLKPFDTPKVFKRIIKEVPNLLIHLDVGHCHIEQKKNLTEAFFKEFGDRIVHLHLSDNKGIEDDHLPLGCGNIDWEKIIKILKKYKFDNSITLEIFSKDRDYLLLSREKLLRWWREYVP